MDVEYRDLDFNSPLNWKEVLSAFDNSSVFLLGAKYATNDYASMAELTSDLSARLSTEFNKEKESLSSIEQWSSEITMVMKHMDPPAMKIQWG